MPPRSPDPLPAAVLAGGLGTRLRPLTHATPKVMVEVNGKPFIHYPLRMLARRGIRRVVLCLGYRGAEVEAYVADGTRFGLEVAYSYDGAPGDGTLRGTAGAIRQALPLLGERFWVMNGDTYLDTDYPAIHRHYLRNALENLVVVYRNRNRGWPSNVALGADGRCTYRKASPTPEMEHIDAGAAILTAAAIRSGGDEPSLSVLYESLGACGALAAYEVAERLYEINTPAGLRRTTRHLERLSREESPCL
ncbi:MAG TPA: sugar phosphate nucleotidyltransferase [Longimicrobiaceae bacterium]|nr:sugar phosphate nucleotidyltransferase [Longimicrobiaceae bacterium]